MLDWIPVIPLVVALVVIVVLVRRARRRRPNIIVLSNVRVKGREGSVKLTNTWVIGSKIDVSTGDEER